MKIEFNSDKTVDWDHRHEDHFAGIMNKELDRFTDHISRIAVHLSDENGTKEGINDIRCLMEVRVEGRKPFAVTNLADSIEQSISGATAKAKASLKTIVERMQHKGN